MLAVLLDPRLLGEVGDLDTALRYVLVSQEEIKIEVYRKDAQENWSIQTLGKGDDLKLNSIGLTLTMADIYEDVLTV